MIAYQSILDDIYEGLTKITKGRFNINEQSLLIEQLDLDSLQIMELILNIEDRFDITIPVNVLKDVKTVKDLVKQIEKLSCDEG